MSVTAYIYLEDPNSNRAVAAELINNNPESWLEVIPVDSGFGLEYGDVLYQGDDSRMLVYEHREDSVRVKVRATALRAFPVWKGDPEAMEWLRAQGITNSVSNL